MKKISLVVPCYNEEANIEALYEAITEDFRTELPATITNSFTLTTIPRTTAGTSSAFSR